MYLVESMIGWVMGLTRGIASVRYMAEIMAIYRVVDRVRATVYRFSSLMGVDNTCATHRDED